VQAADSLGRLCQHEFPAPDLRVDSVRRAPRVGGLADLGARVVVVSAPPGYGKTTLLAEWAAEETRPFLYLPLNDSTDPGRCLDAALARIGAVADHGGKPELSVASADTPTVSPAHARATLEQCVTPFVLAIDDAQLLARAAGSEIIDTLVANLPDSSQIVLAGRGCSGLHLGGLRARRAIFEIDAPVLAFDVNECVSFVTMSGLDLSATTVGLLAEHTEGWPAGMSLATQVAGLDPDPDRAALSFSGRDRYVVDYLNDELLHALPEDTRTFLRRSSVLERLRAPLCDAVLERDDSGAVLEVLAASNAMTFPLDRHGDWYRLHPLFRDVLAHELESHEPGLVAALHLRASAWSEQAGDVDAAVRHAIGADDRPRARELIWQALPTIVSENQSTQVSQWIELLGRPALVEDPALALAVAGFELADGNPGEVAWWIAVAEDDSAGVTDDDTKEGLREILHAFVANDGPHDMRERSARAGHLISPANPLHFLARAFELFAADMEGDRSEARDRWNELLRMSVVRMPQPEAVGEAIFALAAIEDNDWGVASVRIERSRSICARYPWLAEKPGQALTFAVSALGHSRDGARSKAMKDWQLARALVDRIGGFEAWVPVLTRSALARASIVLGDLSAAYVVNDEAVDLLRASPAWTPLRSGVDSVRDLIDRARNVELTSGERSLTPAETRVLKLLPTHLSIGEIAAELFVTRNTVKSQAIAVYRKLEVSSRGEAVIRARELNLIDSVPGEPPESL
jgi:LuxR family transcriptional regulator, maltose regulon positive regulatory protein